MISFADSIIDAGPFGELHVQIYQVKVCPRYPRELIRVKWTVGEYSKPEVWSEFVIKYNDPVLSGKGVFPVYEIEDMDLSLKHQHQVAKAVITYLRFETHKAPDGEDVAEIFFAEDDDSKHPISATVIWLNKHKFST